MQSQWRMLALVSVAEFLGISVWFATSAVGPQLQTVWALDATQAGWLTSVVQLGFVIGTAIAALLNLADVVASRWYFSIAAALAAAANAGVAVATSYEQALVFRFLTGILLAGVYPPAMKMVATWFTSSRGFAIGTLIGALTLGKAFPYLVRSWQLEGHAPVVWVASAAALLAAVLVLALYRDGPHRFPRRPFSFQLVRTIAGEPRTRLAIAGYLGHMWELYAMWLWAPAFAAASLAAHAERTGGEPSTTMADLIAFGTIATGAAGCIWGGRIADRTSKERFVNIAMAASGACCLLVGATFGADPWLTTLVLWIWGFFVVADSAQFSALVTEVAPAHAVGTALTLQTSLGFLLCTVTMQLIPELVPSVGWSWAFCILALGPAAGIGAILRLARLRRAE